MSKIHETAVAIHECLRVQSIADERHLELSRQPACERDANGTSYGILADHAERVCKDAGFLAHTYEQELTTFVAETPADLLTQMLVLASYYHAHELEEGSEAETVVRLLIGRLLEGLIAMTGDNLPPAFADYFDTTHIWGDRLAAVEKSVVSASGVKPSAAA